MLIYCKCMDVFPKNMDKRNKQINKKPISVPSHERHAHPKDQWIHCLFIRWFRLKRRKTPKFNITGPLWGEPLVTVGFPLQRNSNVKSISMLWSYEPYWSSPCPHHCQYWFLTADVVDTVGHYRNKDSLLLSPAMAKRDKNPSKFYIQIWSRHNFYFKSSSTLKYFRYSKFLGKSHIIIGMRYLSN